MIAPKMDISKPMLESLIKGTTRSSEG